MVDEPSPKRVSALRVPGGGGSYTFDGRPSLRHDPTMRPSRLSGSAAWSYVACAGQSFRVILLRGVAGPIGRGAWSGSRAGTGP